MNKAVKILLPIIFLIISAIIVTAGFISTGVLQKPGNGNISDVFNPAVQGSNNKKIIDSLNLIKQNQSRESIKLNDNMNAVWIDFNSDFDFNSGTPVDNIKYSIYSDVNYYRNFLTDTYFISPDSKGEFSELKESDGSSFDVLEYFLYYANELECKTVLVIDDKILDSNDAEKINIETGKYIKNYNFNAVIVSSDQLYGTEGFYDVCLNLSSYIKNNFPSVLFGVEVKTFSDTTFADDNTVKIFDERLAHFAVADCGGAVGSNDIPFAYGAAWWDSFSDYYGIPFICKHRADYVFSKGEAWSDSNEINKQIKILYNLPSFDGSCYYPAVSLKNNVMLARSLSIFLNDVAAKESIDFSLSDLNIFPESNIVKFKGFSRNGYGVFCSDESVALTEGKFEENYLLAPGRNSFDFTSGGEHYTFDLYNNLPLISAFSHHNGFSADENTDISLYAVCRNNSSVYAVVNGNYFPMYPDVYQPENFEIQYGYVLYSCVLNASKTGNFKNRELEIVCADNDIQAVVSCGKVSIGKDSAVKNITAPIEYVSEYKSYTTDKKVTPYMDYGYGKAIMCRTKSDNTVQLGEARSYDTFRPYHSSLLKDTYDYVEKISRTGDGNLVYELKSGIKIYAESAELLVNTFVMPPSSVIVKSFDESSSGSIDMVFGTDWRIPVTVLLQPLNYKKGFMDFSYNIDNFNPEYVDINFYYGSSFSNLDTLKFGENSLFSGSDLFKDESGTLILRLYLRNPGEFYGFRICETGEGDIKVSFKKHSEKSIKGKTVMIDAGHGGYSMTGTALSDNSYSEAQVTVALARKVKKYLEEMGAKVIMTRQMNTSITLSERVEMCEVFNPDVFISIHCDGSDNPEENGTHTFYFKPYSKPLADSIHASLVNTYRTSIYNKEHPNYENIDKRVKYYPFYVTRVDNCPSVLIETGFMTNYTEGQVLVNPAYQEYLAKAMAEGISSYFNNY